MLLHTLATWWAHLRWLSKITPRYLCLQTTERAVLLTTIGGASVREGLILNHIMLDLLRFNLYLKTAPPNYTMNSYIFLLFTLAWNSLPIIQLVGVITTKIRHKFIVYIAASYQQHTCMISSTFHCDNVAGGLGSWTANCYIYKKLNKHSTIVAKACVQDFTVIRWSTTIKNLCITTT